MGAVSVLRRCKSLPMINFMLNRRGIETGQPDGMTVFDFIRQQALTATKGACREGDCGTCQILLGEMINGRIRYRALNSCLLPLGRVAGCHVVTVEGLGAENPN